MSNVTCPYCGFTARKVSSNDGKSWKCVCERCKAVFSK